MKRIALCGAHGTGKTTLLEALTPHLQVPVLARTTRNFWEQHGVFNFELLPKDVRTNFQKLIILNQIKVEDETGDSGFITDRSVVDNYGYTMLSSDMAETDAKMYLQLVKERVKTYTHFIYLPVMFEAENEPLRADVSTRNEFDKLLQAKLPEIFGSKKYLFLDVLDMDVRVRKCLQFINGG